MDQGEGCCQSALSEMREETIQIGNTILLKLPSGDIKTLKLEKDSCDLRLPHSFAHAQRMNSTVNLGKFGLFYSNELVGQPYGLTYDIVDKKLKVIPPRTLQEVGMHPVFMCGPKSDPPSRGH